MSLRLITNWVELNCIHRPLFGSVAGLHAPGALIRMEMEVTVSGSLGGEVRETGGPTLNQEALFSFILSLLAVHCDFDYV